MSVSFVLCEKILSSRIFFSSEKIIQYGSDPSSHQTLDLIYDGAERGAKVDESASPALICGIDTCTQNQQLLTNDSSTNKSLNMTFTGSSTPLRMQNTRESQIYDNIVPSVSNVSLKENEHSEISKDATAEILANKGHHTEVEISASILTEACEKPSLKSSPVKKENTVLEPVGLTVSGNIFRNAVDIASSKRVRKLSENARREMFDPVCTCDMSGIWTFEGFRPIRNVPHGAGLINVKNSCFINSVLQSLVHIAPFTRYALEKHNHISDQEKSWCIWCLMRRTHYQNIFNYKKAYFVGWIVKLWPRLFHKKYHGSQEDAHEFFLKLVNALKPMERSGPGHGIPKAPSSPIDRIFGGKTRYELICVSCGDKTVRYQNFLDLNLALPQKWQRENSPTITDLLVFHMKEEKIEFKCVKCGCNWKTMSTTIFRCPAVLLIHILRFSGYKTKSNMKVDIEKNISLKRFTYLQDDEEKYELSAAIFHIGPSADHGHYTVMTKGFDDRYYYFDDDHVKLVREIKAFSALSAYMLLYSHRRPQKRMQITEDPSVKRSIKTSDLVKFTSKATQDDVVPIHISPDKLKTLNPLSSSFKVNTSETCSRTDKESPLKSLPHFIFNDEKDLTSDTSSKTEVLNTSINKVSNDFCPNNAESEIFTSRKDSVDVLDGKASNTASLNCESFKIIREEKRGDAASCSSSERTNGFSIHATNPRSNNSTEGVPSDFCIYNDNHCDVEMSDAVEGNGSPLDTNSYHNSSFDDFKCGECQGDHLSYIFRSEGKCGEVDFKNEAHMNNDFWSENPNTSSSAFIASRNDIEMMDSEDDSHSPCLELVISDSHSEKLGRSSLQDHQVSDEHPSHVIHTQKLEEREYLNKCNGGIIEDSLEYHVFDLNNGNAAESDIEIIQLDE